MLDSIDDHLSKLPRYLFQTGKKKKRKEKRRRENKENSRRLNHQSTKITAIYFHLHPSPTWTRPPRRLSRHRGPIVSCQRADSPTFPPTVVGVIPSSDHDHDQDRDTCRQPQRALEGNLQACGAGRWPLETGVFRCQAIGCRGDDEAKKMTTTVRTGKTETTKERATRMIEEKRETRKEMGGYCGGCRGLRQ